MFVTVRQFFNRKHYIRDIGSPFMSDVMPPDFGLARGRQIDKADNPPAYAAGSKNLAERHPGDIYFCSFIHRYIHKKPHKRDIPQKTEYHIFITPKKA